MSEEHLVRAITFLAAEISQHNKQKKSEFEWFKSHWEAATRTDLIAMGDRIMSAVSDYQARVDVAFKRIESAQAALQDQLVGVGDDITFLKEQLNTIQDSELSPEAQAALDAGAERLEQMATNAEALQKAITDLNAATTRPSPNG